MDLTQLRTFRAVISAGSVRGAAQALNYSPSTVSQQITALQRQHGVTLLARSGRGLEPTAAGLALADRVDGLISQVGDIEELLSDLREGRTATLTLGYFSSLGTTWLPVVAGRLAREFPEVVLTMRLTEWLPPHQRPHCDVQVVVDRREMTAPPGHRSEHLASEPYLAALPVDHPLASHDQISMRELRHERWVDTDVPGTTCRQIPLDACAAAGFQPNFRAEAHEHVTALELIAQGLGVAARPLLAVRHAPAGVALRPLVDPTPVRHLHVVTTTGAQDNPAAVRAVELLHEVAADAE